MSASYDAIVVGARCGGSPTAVLLARNGYRVLLIDRASFPSDTISPSSARFPPRSSSPRRTSRGSSSASLPRPMTPKAAAFG